MEEALNGRGPLCVAEGLGTSFMEYFVVLLVHVLEEGCFCVADVVAGVLKQLWCWMVEMFFERVLWHLFWYLFCLESVLVHV